ncbi:MAG: zinc ribbon domain-containing protein [Lachnospiraceae bacterium]|nr:zinc ribbon domain-containing protein [Lachnospiraceae bacterium]
MALKKCPDCGKMVSERASMCPECGCPAEFFEDSVKKEEISGENHDQDEIKTELFEAEADVQKDDIIKPGRENIEDNGSLEYKEFQILGVSIRYEEEQKIFIDALKLHNKNAANYAREYRKKYDEVGTMDKVWDVLVPEMNKTVKQVVLDNIKILYKSGIIITEDEFIEKYSVDFISSLEDIMKIYDSVVKDAEKLKKIRQLERSERSYWEGGGFGFSGAIKGAVKAGALNAVTGIGRSIGDSAVDSSDRERLEAEKKKIYDDKNTIKTIMDGFRFSIQMADYGLAMEYENAGFTKAIGLNAKKAWDQSVMAYKHEEDRLKRAQVYLDSISKWTLKLSFYVEVMEYIVQNEVSDNDLDQFIELIRFWDMDEEEYLNSMVLDYERSMIVRNYINTNSSIGEIDFKRFDTDTYIKVRDAKVELEDVLFQQTKVKQFPMLNRVAQEIVGYYKVCADKIQNLDTRILRRITENDAIEAYANSIHDEKVVFPELLNDVWVNGDEATIPERKLKAKWMLPEADSIIMYQNNAIFGTAFGGKGFVLTSSRICDLKSKTQININQIIAVRYEKETKLIIVSSGDKQIQISTEKQGAATRSFLCNCLNDIIERYSDTITDEDKHRRIVMITSEKILGRITEFSQVNGIDDEQALFRQFMSDLGYVVDKKKNSQESDPDHVIDMMFCVSCGNKIPRNAKFCTFCGAKNEYVNTKGD